VRAVLARAPTLQSIDQEGVYWDRLAERAEADRSPPVNLIVTGGRGELGEARLGGGLAWAFPVVRRNEGEIARARYESQRTRSLRAAFAVFLEARARAAFDRFSLTRQAVAILDAQGLPAAERVVDATYAASSGQTRTGARPERAPRPGHRSFSSARSRRNGVARLRRNDFSRWRTTMRTATKMLGIALLLGAAACRESGAANPAIVAADAQAATGPRMVTFDVAALTRLG